MGVHTQGVPGALSLPHGYCMFHRIFEGDPEEAYVSCGHCGHLYPEPKDLVAAHMSTIFESMRFTEVASEVTVCPLCWHKLPRVSARASLNTHH